MFVDKVRITVCGGRGGDGAVAFHREKYVAAGGPDGGDGGHGGSVILRVNDNLSTLLDFRYKRKYAAQAGVNGQGRNMSGKRGENLIIQVPRGTVVRDAETNQIIVDMSTGEDFVLAKGMFSKLAHLRMYINGKPSGRYAADGLIISTATGSTAYSLSAGGPLVMPELDVSVITPVCAHSLTARALVIPLSDCIELKAVPGSEEMMLSCDGENVIEVRDDTFVRIEKSPYTMKLIRLTSRDYYQTWQQKLMRNV